MDNTDIIYWDHQYNSVLLLNLLLVIAIFASVRFVSGSASHLNSSKELTEKDNPAFGISVAGVVFAVAIILTGAIYGDPIYTMQESVISVGLYGVIGTLLMVLARAIFNKIALPSLSIRSEIVKGNTAAGIIDAGNVIATAIIIRAMMMWVDANTIEGIVAILVGFVISQCLLAAATFIRIKILNGKLTTKSIHDEFKAGNVALALRFAGRKIGTAFAVASASNLLVFELYDLPMLLLIWTGASIVMIAALSVLSYVANKIILAGIRTDDEVIKQRNIAMGAIQFAIYICLGLLLSELLA